MGELSPNELKENAWRIFSITSFIAFGVIIGVPVWWKTTETYRVSLPYDKIEQLAKKDLFVPIQIELVAGEEILWNDLSGLQKELQSKCSGLRRWIIRDEYNVSLRYASAEEKQKSTLRDLTEHLNVHKNIGKLTLYFLPPSSNILTSASKFYVTRHRVVFVKHSGYVVDEVLSLISTLINRNGLQSATANVIAPHLIVPDKTTMRTLRSSPGYDVTFTLLVPEPHLVTAKWDAESAVQMYFQPLVSKLSSLIKFNIKSQILYLTSLNIDPNYNQEEKHFYLTPDQLPHILNPVEAKLGSHVSVVPNVNFVICLPTKNQSPLYIYDHSGKPLSTNAFLTPRWGGILIYNVDYLEGQTPVQINLDSHKIMSVFLTEIRLLLGLQLHTEMQNIYFEPLDDSLITDWEYDYLLRKLTLENVATVSNTLRSLAQLLGQIENIVINDDVGNSVFTSVDATMKSVECLEKGDALQAFSLSSTGQIASEKAFFDPSMLALLYFPDDQKYAVYVPLFLPVGVPVLFSVFYIIKAIKAHMKGAVHIKSD